MELGPSWAGEENPDDLSYDAVTSLAPVVRAGDCLLLCVVVVLL